MVGALGVFDVSPAFNCSGCELGVRDVSSIVKCCRCELGVGHACSG
jgi:hypothetical protein